jgi:hypothetical protein
MKTEQGGTVEEKKGRDMFLQTEGIPEDRVSQPVRGVKAGRTRIRRPRGVRARCDPQLKSRKMSLLGATTTYKPSNYLQLL